MNKDILFQFYEALRRNRPMPHIPHSSVFYVRQKYFVDTGSWEELDRIERAMYLEGMIGRKDVLDPDRCRDWETLKGNN